jgi:tetratricopeptide (TPR) repeat protein
VFATLKHGWGHGRRPIAAYAGLKLAVALAVALAWNEPQSMRAAQDDSWVGQRVMVIRDGAQFRAPGIESAPAPFGLVLDVSHVSDDWLWFTGRQGWLRTQDVVQLEGAIERLTRDIEQDPTSAAYRRRGVAYVAMAQFDLAVADFQESVRRDNSNVAAYNDLGNALQRLGRLDEALETFNALISRGVRHPAVYANRGLVWRAKGDLVRALADYNSAIAIDNQFAPAWEAGGAAREALGEFERAIANYRRAIAIEPEFDRAHNNLAWILATNPNQDLRSGAEALEHATKACELTGYEDGGYLDTLAAALAESGRFEEAITRAGEAVEKSPAAMRPAIEGRIELYKAGQPYRAQ